MPHTKVSVTIPDELLEQARVRSAQRGLSAYVSDALAHQLRLDVAGEAVADYEREHGAFSAAEIEAARRHFGV